MLAKKPFANIFRLQRSNTSVQGGCEFGLGKLLNKALPRIQIDDVEAFGATVPVRPLTYERNTAWHSIAMHCGGSDKILAIDPAEKCIDC